MAVKEIQVLHLSWDRTDQNERWAITQPTGAFPEELPNVRRAARDALGTGKYTLVADLVTHSSHPATCLRNEAEVLEYAFLHTNHIDRVWNDGNGPFVARPGRQRSTGCGDIIRVTRDAGVSWHVAVSFGFEEIITSTREAA